MKKKKYSLTKFGWIFFALLLALGLGYALISSLNKAPSELAKVEMKTKQAGKYRKDVEKMEDSWFVLHYPQFNEDALSEFVENNLASFKNQIGEMDSSLGFMAKSDYRSYQKDKKTTSLEMSLVVDGQIVDVQQITVSKENDFNLGSILVDKAMRYIAYESLKEGDSQIELAKTYHQMKSSNQFYVDNQVLSFGQKDYDLQDYSHYLINLDQDESTELDIPYVYIPRLIDKKDKKLVAFTFDDGPHPTVTSKVASFFESIDSRVTFFNLGLNIEKYPEILVDLAHSGHEVAYHSYGHLDLLKLSPESVKYEVNETSLMIQKVLNSVGPILLRPPYGSINDSVMQLFDNPVVNWTVDSNDWGNRDAASICHEIIKNTEAGDIILLHDIYEFSYEGAVCAANKLKENGFEFVTVSELITAYEVPLLPQTRYYSATNHR